MRILVFTSKWIGLELINSLLTQYNNDEYIFVVSDPDSKKIIETINNFGHKYMLLNDSTIKWIKKQDEKSFDWLLNLWGGYVFKEDIISRVVKSLNVHPSFLPYGRGRDPVFWSLRNDQPSGVTLHEISLNIDDGPILYQEEIYYEFPITGGQLYDLVIKKCIEVFSKQWPLLRSDKSASKIQHGGNEYKTAKRKDLISDNLLNLDKDKISRELLLRVLASDFGENYSLKLNYRNKRYSIRLLIEQIEFEGKDE